MPSTSATSSGRDGYAVPTKIGRTDAARESLDVLVKALVPLPDKWHGLIDVEKRYRQRYVDLIVNPEVRDVFITRSRIVAEMRRFIDARGFYEVETPTLLAIAGGAPRGRSGRTRTRSTSTLDLRIATELNLKRLIVGGLERVYEIGRIFRNEGIDTTHNPEFTMLELYAAYWSVDDMMAFNEELIAHLVRFDARRRYADLRRARDFVRAPVRARRVPRGDAASTAGSSATNCSIPPAPRGCSHASGSRLRRRHGHALDKIFERIVEPHSRAADFRLRLSGR